MHHTKLNSLCCLGLELREVPIWWRFFSQISWHLPTFQTYEAIFSKPRIDMDTMFSLKVAQDPRLHVRQKMFRKNSASWVFWKKFLKKLDFSVFFFFDPLYHRTETIYRVHGFVICTSVTEATFWRQNVFMLGFFGQRKRWKKSRKKLFLIRSSYFSKLIQKPFSFEKNSMNVGYFWTNKVSVIKYDAFVFLQKTLELKKILWSFLLGHLYIMTETKYGVHGFVNFTRPLHATF